MSKLSSESSPNLKSVWSQLGMPKGRAETAATVTPDEGDMLMREALEGRYGKIDKNNYQDTISRMYDDMGLKPYNVKYDEVKNLSRSGDPMDGINFGSQISVEKNKSPIDKVMIMMHELAHTGDNAKSMYSLSPGAQKDGPTGGDFNPNHHESFVNFEGEMPLVMSAQARIEQGLPVSQELLDKYPQLQKVNPYSSNTLAVPWNEKTNLIPPNVWNAMGRSNK